MHVEQVRFRSGQVCCAADLYLPDGIADRAPAPAVVMGHSVVMVKEALGPHAEHLARAGFVVLAVDWRTVGSSEGEPRCQWLPFWQVEDLRSGVSYLRTRGPRSTPSGSGSGATARPPAWPSWPAPSTAGSSASPARTPACSMPGRRWRRPAAAASSAPCGTCCSRTSSVASRPARAPPSPPWPPTTPSWPATSPSPRSCSRPSGTSSPWPRWSRCCCGRRCTSSTASLGLLTLVALVAISVRIRGRTT